MAWNGTPEVKARDAPDLLKECKVICGDKEMDCKRYFN
jgi:hypothetical protein